MEITPFFQIFFLPFMTAGIAAMLIGPLTIRLYKHFHWLDDPNLARHPKVIHSYPVPRGGGLVIATSVLIGMVLFLPLDKHTFGIILSIILLALLGVLDDLRDLNPYLRLVLGLLASAFVVIVGIGIAYITNPFGGGVISLNNPQIPIYFLGKLRTIWIIADLFAIVWITWCMNMVNWSKGVDGQLPGVVGIAAVFIALLSFRFNQDVAQWPVTILAAITAGSFFGFLPFNIYPQKMMPGYGAGALGGFLLAVLSILSGAKLATLILVLAVPMLDALFVMISRIVKGKSPVWGDTSHLHHRLLKLGWSKRQIAGFYWLVTLAMGSVALQLNARQKTFTIILITLVFFGVLLWVDYFISSSRQPAPDNG